MHCAWRERFAGVVKALALLAVFVVIQHQIAVMRTEVDGASGRVADALDRYRGEFAQAREELVGVVEASNRQLLDIRQGLERSASSLEDPGEAVTRVLATRERELHSSFDLEFARYRGELERVLDRSSTYDRRIATVEEKVGKVLARDSGWMARAMLFPIAQLKGEGTVGSGVLVYSGPRPAGTDAEGGEPASYVITACHVVMEILGSKFPAGTVEDLRLIDQGGTGELLTFPARVEVYDEDRDLALLRLETPRRFDFVAHCLPADRFAAIELFSRVYAVGCPLGNNPLPSFGEISSKEKVVGSQKFWMVNAPTFFGNSGGGIFLAGSCELVGISSMIYTYGKTKPVVVPHMGLFVPLDEVGRWLREEGYAFVLEAPPPAKRGAQGAAAAVGDRPAGAGDPPEAAGDAAAPESPEPQSGAAASSAGAAGRPVDPAR